MKEEITLGAGCFWGVEATFRKLEGVSDVVVGYSGGSTTNPTYKEVCTGNTGHAEVAKVTFDPKVVSVEKVLETFWNCHDPTTLNRQGPDVGTQYRSVIFYHSAEQQKAAEESKAALDSSGSLKNRVVTLIEPAASFYPAEEYHQRYFEKNNMDGCPI